jgi:hypothetical protein
MLWMRRMMAAATAGVRWPPSSRASKCHVVCTWAGLVVQLFLAAPAVPAEALPPYCCCAQPLCPCRRFLKLPSAVRVLVTGRPEVGKSFEAWPTTLIQPEAAENTQARA